MLGLAIAKMYRWFAQPEELPPIGGVWREGILHDVYVLRSESRNRVPAVSTQPYLKDSLASMRDAALIINSDGRMVWCNDAAEYLLSIRFEEEEENHSPTWRRENHSNGTCGMRIFKNPCG